MLEGSQALPLLSLAVSLVALSLGIYVYLKNPYLNISTIFVAIMCVLAINGAIDFLMMNAPDALSAKILAMLDLFFVCLVFALLLFLILVLRDEKNENRLFRHRGLYVTMSMVVAVVPALLVDQMELSRFGWGVPSSLPMSALGIVVAVFVVSADLILLRSFRSAASRETKRLDLLLMLGLSFPLIYGLSFLVLGPAMSDFPTILSPGFLVTAFILTYMVLKDRLFIVVPTKEPLAMPNEEDGRTIRMSQGSCELLEGKKSDPAYDLFVAKVSSGAQGLLLTRAHPDIIKARYGLVQTPIIWLASQPGQGRIDPTSLSILQHTIVDYLQKGENAVIMLDGLEYLVTNNSADKVLKMLYAIKDAVVMSGGKFIVPLDPDSLSQKDRALFEKEFTVMVDKRGAGSEI